MSKMCAISGPIPHSVQLKLVIVGAFVMVKGYPHRRRVENRRELSLRIAIYFNGNSFAQFGTKSNSSLVWMGL